MLDYQMHGDVAVLTMDDGKANAVSHAYIDALSEGLDRAEEQAKAIVLLGRAGVFSAGFDLKEIGKGPAESKALVDRGAALLFRLFTFPMPVVAASAGHAIAAGALLPAMQVGCSCCAGCVPCILMLRPSATWVCSAAPPPRSGG